MSVWETNLMLISGKSRLREYMMYFFFRSMEYADVLQENNTIVVTSGQVLVDGQAVKLRVDNEHRNFVLTSL